MLGWLGGLGLLLGCVTAKQHLAAGRFEEACLATRMDPILRAETAAAISARSDATIRVHALDDAEVTMLLGADLLDDRSILLRVNTDAPRAGADHHVDVTVRGLRAGRVFAGGLLWSHEELARLLGLEVEYVAGDGRKLFDRMLGAPPRDTWEPRWVCRAGEGCAERVAFAQRLHFIMTTSFDRCDHGRRQPCELLVLLRADGPDEAGPAVLRLGVQHSLGSCWTEHLVELPLAEGVWPGDGVNRRFAAGPLGVRDLPP